jgi:hypothetical protein
MVGIKERNVEWHPKTLKGIAQVPTDGMEFAYVSEDYKQVHQLVWCKDFMQDTIFGSINNKEFEIYGFKYDPKNNPPICTKKTRIMVCNWRDHDFGTKLLNNCREFINEIEDKMKMKHTIFEKCASPPPIYRKSGVYIVEGSKRWMIAPPMISFYTLILRIGMVHPIGQSAQDTLNQIQDGSLKPYNWKEESKGKYGSYHEDDDSDFLKNGIKGINRIFEEGERKIFHRKIEDNYDPKAGVHTIHDDCGLGGFSNNYTKYIFPKWLKKEKAK